MIDRFTDGFEYLSNFHMTHKPVKVGDLVFKSNEHFYQAHKTLDLDERIWITDMPTPGQAKRAGSPEGYLGRTIAYRNDWDTARYDVMYTGLFLKFTTNYELGALLIGTLPKHLKEGNYWHDNFWGDCSCSRCSGILGQNNLGLMLMYIRKTLATTRI